MKISAKQKKINVLVTGAAGCVGSQLIELLLEKDFQVLGVDRVGADFPKIKSPKFKILKGDLTDNSFTKSITKGIDVVINTAASVDISKKFEELAPINLEAVKVLYESAKTDSVGFFLHFSTGSIYKESNKPYQEDAPTNPPNPYALTKALSEEFLLSQDSTGLRINIIRPALIYGPKGKVLAGPLATVGPLLKELTSRLYLIKGGPRSNWVHARDVARACIFLAENPQPSGEIFHVANDDPIPFGEVVSITLKHSGINLFEPAVEMPTRLIKLLYPYVVKENIFKYLNIITNKLWKYYVKKKNLKSELTPRLDMEAMKFAINDTIFDNAKLKNLGFQYEYPTFEPGWINTIKWYKEARWIP